MGYQKIEKNAEQRSGRVLKQQTRKSPESIFPSEPERLNIYQYPPPIAVGEPEKKAFFEKLELSKPLDASEPFTIFVSVPYCRTRCNSCPYFKALLPTKEPNETIGKYASTIEKQVAFYASKERFRNARLGSVYLGGGTASLLSSGQVVQIVELINSSFKSKGAEITLEGNPKELKSEAYLHEVAGHGVNRVSMGYQSKQERLLEELLGSPHSAEEGQMALNAVMRAGFNTVNVDLLYGVPGQKFGEWKYDLSEVVKTGPESITINSYIVYPHTLTAYRIAHGIMEEPISGDERHKWYLYARKKFLESGYVQARTGSFVKPGHEQIYAELAYEKSKESIPIGAGAYGLINGYMFRATGSPDKFMDNISEGLFTSPDFQSIKASKEIMMDRYVMQNLSHRRIYLEEFKQTFGLDLRDVYPTQFERMEASGLVKKDEEKITLTDLGVRWHQNIFRMFVSEEVKGLLRN
ncbi:MAG: hypothetical protein KGH57_03900 [Candidatus Micrarchaeota archaeon]|nr:hypothetical protein [Candidatus Micrarchaeota archaeon]